MQTNNRPQKVWIIGLPRTATTSVCLAMLDLGFKTAHTAYTNEAFEQAEAIADTPVFADYAALDAAYPNSKFIYLQRDVEAWLPSIRQLLERMYENLMRDDGGFNPYLKRCYQHVFSPLSLDNIASDEFLTHCYQRHQTQVFTHFEGKEQQLLSLDVTEADGYQKLARFLNVDVCVDKTFEVINKGGKVTAWNKIKHPLKVESTRNGRIDNSLYQLN